MKTEKKILIAFILNLAFSIFEFIGGMITGSVAILSDAIHDLADAFSIGVSFFLEKRSGKQPDSVYTYGYARLSVLGSVITTSMLLIGSVIVIYNAISRLITPTPVHYTGMIIFAIVGVCVNLGAALITSRGNGLNQKAVNLHMMEDVLGWIVVLIGAVIMRFTDWVMIDPILSIGVAVFIAVNAIKTLKAGVNIFMEKSPDGVSVSEIRDFVLEIRDVLDVHHVHVWTMDGQNHYATMHIVSNAPPNVVKELVRHRLKKYGIAHVTLELEQETEGCQERYCHVEHANACGHCHHHHHS